MIDYAADAALLAELGKISEAHPELPDLVSRRFDEQGMHALPWLHLNPVTGLLRWTEALPGRWAVHAEPAPGGVGTQLTARGTLTGRSVALTVVTWRTTPVARRDGLVTRDQLRHLATEEATHASQEAAHAAAEAAAVLA